MSVLLLLAVLVGYVVGAVSPSSFLAARRGVDLRAVGSGNPGATNASRALGRRAGVAVALLDVLKGLVPAAAFGVLDPRAGLLAGLAAVLGHVTSPFLRGRGGKGVATAAGAVLGVHPLWGLVALLVWLCVFATTRWVALASVAGGLSVAGIAVLLREDVLWALAIAAVILVRHRRNLARRLALRRTAD